MLAHVLLLMKPGSVKEVRTWLVFRRYHTSAIRIWPLDSKCREQQRLDTNESAAKKTGFCMQAHLHACCHQLCTRGIIQARIHLCLIKEEVTLTVCIIYQ